MNKKQKTLLSLVFVFVSLLLVGGGVTAFIINYNLQTAPVVEILDDGNIIYAKTAINNDYKGYRFKFVGESGTFYIESKNNIISISDNEKINIGEKYSVSVCYLGEIEGNNSEYSKEISWTSYDYLSSPILTISEDNSSISWNEVKNATYYLVYHGAEFERVLNTQLELKKLTGGEKDIFVIAYSDKQYHKPSNKSNILKDVTVRHELLGFEDIQYDEEQFILTLTGYQSLELINIYINNSKYQTSKFTSKKLSSGKYEFTVNISAIYHGFDYINIGAEPASNSQFDFFDGEIKYL